jgi:transcriptional regulator with PAS, ATPase and Fis domain
MRRIGSIKERRVDVRLLAATNRNLSDQVKAGKFREDLYYRINVMSLELPPLRERAGDIPLLLDHFIGPGWEMEEDARAALIAYDWPGNVRELINAVERAKILADDNLLRISDFPREAVEHHSMELHEVGLQSDDLAAIERAKVVEVLRREAGNKTRAARALGIDRRKLYRLVEKYAIHSGEVTEASSQPS